MATISQVAAQTGLRPSAIRYYESLGLLPLARREGGKRVYEASIFSRIAMILLAKAAGLSLRETRTVLLEAGTGVPREAWRGLAEARQGEIQREIERLQLQQRVIAALGQCSCTSLDGCGHAFATTLERYKITRAAE